ncbi:MAG: N-acetylmuramoyl-L-alanine amidase [Alphaproteobacteria bacterium]|nr:N-acetylmuramoyl-L-alanine amidase [Alphaproteobacteria bacterium]
MLRRAFKYLIILAITLSSPPVLGQIVTAIRASQEQNKMRLVFDLSKEATYSVSPNKRELIIKIPKIQSHQITAEKLGQIQEQYHEFVQAIHFKTLKGGLKIRLICKPHVSLVYHSCLKKDHKFNKPPRIILDFMLNPPNKKLAKAITPKLSMQEAWDSQITRILTQSAPAPTSQSLPEQPQVVDTPKNIPLPIQEQEVRKQETYDLSLPKEKPLYLVVQPKPKPLIVIDPGHGGEDPGAISPTGVQEKNVTLAIATKLQQDLLKTGQFRVSLTRTTDVFVSLAERLDYAKRQQADLFISIHADSHPDPKMHGLSIYTLSKTASDKEAENLARRENSADQIKGIRLHHENVEVANILIDLTQRETSNRSRLFAKTLIDVFRNKKYRNLIPSPNRAAAFVVLKAQDIPSALVEMGYLSNKSDVTWLSQTQSQNELVRDLGQTIQTYFSRIP